MKEASIPGIIKAHAEQRPDNLAILSINRAPMTYGQLQRQTSAVVGSLNGLNIGRGDHVAVVVPSGPEMATAFLTISSGATCVPLNPAFKRSEFDSYLSDLDTKLVVVQSGFDSPIRDVAKEQNIRVLDLIPDADISGVFELTLNGEILSLDNSAPRVFSKPEDVAMILFTSGTTSQPKKVAIGHLHLDMSADARIQIFSLTEQDRCLNVMPYFHVHALKTCLLTTMKAGGSMFCTNGFSPSSFFETLALSQASWYSAVPTVHQTILARAENSEMVEKYPHLRFIRSTSAGLAPDTLEKLEDLFNVPVIETYGMTETSHTLASNSLPPAIRKSGSVGPASGPELAIIDTNGGFLEVRETGEIVVRGDELECGYMDDDEANEKAFINGWFRTGDLGYLDEDGYLFITGRLKEVINRSGENIIPKEIDDVLLRHPAVRQAVTFAVPDELAGEEVAAAIILEETETVLERELQDFCSVHLVDSKVPRRIIFLAEIPKGPSGKLMRIGLAEHLGMDSVNDQVSNRNPGVSKVPELENPNTPTEEHLVEVWKDVLGLSELGVTQEFLNVGGDSIQVGQIRAKVEDEFGVELSFIDFFDSPTVRDLSGVIDNMLANGLRSGQNPC